MIWDFSFLFSFRQFALVPSLVLRSNFNKDGYYGLGLFIGPFAVSIGFYDWS